MSCVFYQSVTIVTISHRLQHRSHYKYDFMMLTAIDCEIIP